MKHLGIFALAAAALAQQPDVLTSLATATAAAKTQTALVATQGAAIASQATTIASLNAQLAAATHPTGITKYFEMTSPIWNPYLDSIDPAVQANIRATVQRLGTFTTYFDAKLAWFPNALVYFDSYAIYNPSALATQHPEWILRDAAGAKLFIPWGCSNGTCPQYAADIGSPTYRAYQISQLRAALAPGYRGVWLDDVNMVLAVGDGNSNVVRPIDPRTGAPMPDAAWRQYFAEYVEAIRAAFPTAEILHNSVWFTSRDLPNDPSIRRQHLAADEINVERGFGDAGVGGGTGPWSLQALMTYIDYVHSLGRAVVIEDLYAADEPYSVACYYLIQNGLDYFGAQDLLPPKWPANLKFNLGQAKGARYAWQTLQRRDFANGIALVAEPGAASVTVQLPSPMIDDTGATVATVTMAGKTGKLLRFTP